MFLELITLRERLGSPVFGGIRVGFLCKGIEECDLGSPLFSAEIVTIEMFEELITFSDIMGLPPVSDYL